MDYSSLRIGVFNTCVENSVEKRGRIFVTDAVKGGSAFCTGARAGTFVVHLRIADAMRMYPDIEQA
jgi:hypothetical protein